MEVKKFLLTSSAKVIADDYNCVYCHEKGNEVVLACHKCLFDGNVPDDKNIEQIKQVWDMGVIVRKQPQAVINFLKILQKMIEQGEIITGSRVCEKHKELELILGDKDKEFCIEWTLGSLVKYETNENIRKEIERRKKAGLWTEWYDNK